MIFTFCHGVTILLFTFLFDNKMTVAFTFIFCAIRRKRNFHGNRCERPRDFFLLLFKTTCHISFVVIRFVSWHGTGGGQLIDYLLTYYVIIIRKQWKILLCFYKSLTSRVLSLALVNKNSAIWLAQKVNIPSKSTVVKKITNRTAELWVNTRESKKLFL